MSKFYKVISAMAGLVLLSSMVPDSVHASANMGAHEQEETQAEGSLHHEQQVVDFNDFLHNIFQGWEDRGQDNTGTPPETEKPKTSKEPEQEEQEQVPEPDVEQPEKQPNDQNQGDTSELKEFEQQVVELTNQERQKHGLEPLKVDYELSHVSLDKSRDMQDNNYFDHNSPVYGSPFDMMDDYGVDYRTAGENIAKGQRSPQEVVDGWMNSQGHRENILNGNFTHIGVGYIEQGNIWTQQFIGK